MLLLICGLVLQKKSPFRKVTSALTEVRATIEKHQQTTSYYVEFESHLYNEAEKENDDGNKGEVFCVESAGTSPLSLSSYQLQDRSRSHSSTNHSLDAATNSVE